MSNHHSNKKQSERDAIEPIIPIVMNALALADINDKNMQETEEPDFVFIGADYKIGIEVVECHPSIFNLKKKKDNAPALESFKDKICKAFSNNLYLKYITKGYNNKLRIVIDYDNALSTKYDVQSICAALEYYLIAYHTGEKARKGRVIRGIRVSKTIGQNIIQFNNIGRVDPIKCSSLCDCIERKNVLFDAYKSKHPCLEYWLCIHLPWEEYKHSYSIDYDESGNRLSKLLKKSKFKRICITGCCHGDLRWLKGGPEHSKQCKRTKTLKNVRRTPKSLNLKRLRQLRLWCRTLSTA